MPVVNDQNTMLRRVVESISSTECNELVEVGPGFPWGSLGATVAIARKWDTARRVRHSRRSETYGTGRGDRI
jgi:hypothetical protein